MISVKKIGKFIGASWTSPDASGLQSLVWRSRWEETRRAEYRQRLMIYNKEDCKVLKLLTDVLAAIKDRDDSITDVDNYIHSKKSRSSKAGNPLHHQLEAILDFGRTSHNYNKNKIRFREDQKKEVDVNEKSAKRFYSPHKKKYHRPTRIIRVPERTKCPKCGNGNLSELMGSHSLCINQSLFF